MSPVLARVVAGDRAEFASDHWGLAPLLSRAGQLPAGFGDLLSPDAVDELVSRRGLRTPFLRMAKDGSVLASTRYTRGGGAGAGSPDQVADDKVLSLLDGGATLVLQALHRTWPPLIDFANELAAEIGHPVQINAYITPPQNQGFAPHYDVHDVFVLQITGSKQWRIHEPVLLHPLPEQDWESYRDEVTARASEAPLLETVLEPGDALYLPRGFLHSAQALGQTSIHLTVGVHPITGHRLVRELVASAVQDEALRRSLPMGVDLGDPAVLAGVLSQTVAALHRRIDEVPAADVATALAAELARQTRAEPLGPLATLAAVDQLTLATRLRLRRGIRVQARTDEHSITLRLIDTTVRFPLTAEAALKVVLDGVVFAPHELPALDADEQLVIARRLLREGIAVPA